MVSSFPQKPCHNASAEPCRKGLSRRGFLQQVWSRSLKKEKKWRKKVAGSLSYTKNFSQTKRSSEAGGEEVGTSVREIHSQSNSAGGGKKTQTLLFFMMFCSLKNLLSLQRNTVSRDAVPFVLCLFFFFPGWESSATIAANGLELHFNPAGSSGVYVQINSQMSQL